MSSSLRSGRKLGRLLRNVAPVSCIALFAAGLWATPWAPHTSPKPPKKKIDYNRDVRPIIEKCFSCHGHDPKALQAGLRLDIPDGAVKKLDDGVFAIVPFHPEKSELINRINATNKNELMPPPSSNKVLTPDEKLVLKEWIAEGAEYKTHWAFVAPVRPPLPEVKLKSWPINEIDRFVLSKLEESGLKPSPDADRHALIRRVSLDLTGLPPTTEEVDAFVQDKSPNAYEKVIDRLLASPRYGERMAMDWMDYARYADSNGYQSDWERFQWRWRDWVIDAFNKNMPYDEFTVEQLAGDLLPSPTLDQRIATGFNRNHRINTEGGVIPEEWRVENVIDRVETTSAIWLGLTTGCARCHDHKYDPISQKDFYSLCAYFNNVPESGSGEERPVNHPPFISAPYPDQAKRMTVLQADLSQIEKKMDQLASANDSAAENWNLPTPPPMPSLDEGLIARYRLSSATTCDISSMPKPKVVGPATFDAGRSTGAVATGDNAYIDLGNVGDFDWNEGFSYGAWINRQGDGGSPISRMDSGSNYRGYDIYLEGGKPAVHIINSWPKNALKVASQTMIPKGEWTHLFITYDGSAKPQGLKIYINGKQTPTDTEQNSLSATIRNNVSARIGRRTDSDFFMGKVDDPMFYKRALKPEEVERLASVDPAAAILSIDAAKRTPSQRQTLDQLYSIRNDKTYQSLNQEHETTEKEKGDLASRITTVMVMEEMKKPRDCFILVRGQYDHHGPKVTAAVPVSLPPLPKGVPNNRLGLAEWIVDPSNPLTARVTVNRMWERLFGTGIVSTSEDFGTRSDFPSHPELLDWLATELHRQHWNLKAMWKELVMSRTYRQSSNVTPELLKVDPTNKLLSRGPRFRLPAEVIRDQAIAFGGMLTEKIGGPSVHPYQPDGLWEETSVYGNLHNYKHDIGPDLHRRSLYTIWKRTAAPPEMTLFDAAQRETCRVRRARTDTPLQALALLNDVTYVEAARAVMQRMLREGGTTPSERIDFLFRTVLSREPTAEEKSILTAGIERRIEHFKANPDAAKKLLNEGDLEQDNRFDPAVRAAYTVAASTVLNLDETVTKE